MDPVAWIEGLEGFTPVAVISARLFVEEVGVPLPFAPGDLLLAIGGTAIAAGRHAAPLDQQAVAVDAQHEVLVLVGGGGATDERRGGAQ